MIDKRRNNPDCASGIFFLLLGISVCYFSWLLGVGRPSSPGPGFMPFLSGLSLIVFTLILISQVVLGKTRHFGDINFGWGKVFLILGAMTVYAFLLNRIGFAFITFAFVTFLIKYIEPQSWKKAVIGGAISSVASYILFETFLKSQLPRTFLGYF